MYKQYINKPLIKFVLLLFNRNIHQKLRIIVQTNNRFRPLKYFLLQV